jgi:hypothetical protein
MGLSQYLPTVTWWCYTPAGCLGLLARRRSLSHSFSVCPIGFLLCSVDHVEPWLSGNARGPSSAFCLLYRLGQLQPSVQELREMLEHKDSPYIRALGLLYLRYCCNPRELWKWVKKYLNDSETFSPSPEGQGKTITIGTFARDILLDQVSARRTFQRFCRTRDLL